jgi:hypothetical protein
MYCGVPMMRPVTVADRLGGDEPRAGNGTASTTRRSRARPQSITTVSPNSPISTFAGLRSRCTTCSLCAYPTASQAAIRCGRSASRSAVVVAAARTSFRVRPETSFIT